MVSRICPWAVSRTAPLDVHVQDGAGASCVTDHYTWFRFSNSIGGAMSTTGWIILVVVLFVVFGGGFGWSRRRR